MTASELIAASYRMVGNHNPDAEKLKFGLEALNLVIDITFWGDKIQPVVEFLDDEIIYEPPYVRAFKFILAEDLGIEYGWQVPQIVIQKSEEAKRWLRRLGVQEVEPVEYDQAIVSNRTRFDILGG